MKRLIIIVAFLVAAIAGVAQDKKWNVGVGGGIALPTDDAANYTQMGFGACLTGMFCFSKNFAAGASLSYASLRAKTQCTVDLDNTSIRSLLLRGVYTFTEQQLRPYVAIFTGFYSSKICKCLHVAGSAETSIHITDNNYGYGVEAGLCRGNLNFGIAYNVITIDFKYVFVNLGYTFKL
jgi:hypothetical protein